MDRFQHSGHTAEDDVVDLDLDAIQHQHQISLDLEALDNANVPWPQAFVSTGGPGGPGGPGAYIKTEDDPSPPAQHLFGAGPNPTYTASALSNDNFINPFTSQLYQPQAGAVDFLSPLQASETSGETSYSPLDSGSDHFSQQQLSTFQTPVAVGLQQVPPQPFLPGQFGNMAIPLGHPEAIPALDFNGYILYASGRNVPEELMRIPSGTSVAEPGSIFDEENGRTYHNHHSGAYYYPNDPAEQDRLDLQHKIFKILHDGGLHRAPVQNPKQVLDVACGTGIWAIQYAWDHPDANVIGTDLSLIQPVNGPPNCSFVKEDSEKDPWVAGAFPANFDFIYLRLVNAAFNDHLAVMKKCFDNMEPGGWIEYNDASFELICTDGSIEGSSIQKWAQLMMEAGKAAGRDFSAPTKYKQWLTEAGFVDVVEDVGPLPGNPWPSDPKYKEMGKFQMMNFYRGMRGMCWKLFRGYGMTPEEIESLVDLARDDLRNTRLHFSYPLFVVYARKPFPGEAVPAA